MAKGGKEIFFTFGYKAETQKKTVNINKFQIIHRKNAFNCKLEVDMKVQGLLLTPYLIDCFSDNESH